MPNWCENDVTIYGKKEDLDAIQTLLKSDDSEFDFDRLIPVPEEFKGVTTGFCTIDGKEVRCWRVIDGQSVPVSGEELASLRQKYGFDNWYDWSCANWDTKWNTSDVSVERTNGYGDNDKLFYSLNTAWSPPESVFRELIRRFPQCSFCIEWFECGCSFCGGINHEEGADPSEDQEWSAEYHGCRGG